MKILITGGKGMLGRTLQKQLSHHQLMVAKRQDMDVTNRDGVAAFISSSLPDVVVHCAAMTAVDQCEAEAERAFAVNAEGSANVAQVCHRMGARLIALSTDYVFGGDAERAYHEDDEPTPKTQYGKSKLAGEIAIQKNCSNHVVLRVAWLYGPGGPSFVHTMLKLGASTGDPVRVVNDQRGNPTSTKAVGNIIDHLIDKPITGIIHATCEGEATWYQMAQAIWENKKFHRCLEPCTTAEFPRPAPRPANSCLEKKRLGSLHLPPMPPWKEALTQFLEENPHG